MVRQCSLCLAFRVFDAVHCPTREGRANLFSFLNRGEGRVRERRVVFKPDYCCLEFVASLAVRLASARATTTSQAEVAKTVHRFRRARTTITSPNLG